jgi:uncharacterized delta-60 repeat protein
MGRTERSRPLRRESPRRRQRSGSPHCRRLSFERLEERRLLAAGDLDPTFGVGGKVTTEFFHSPSSAFASESAYAVAITAGGKIVAVGSVGSSSYYGYIAQYNANGSLDSMFGDQGLAAFHGEAQAVAVQSDGKIVVVGNGGRTEIELGGSGRPYYA